MPSPSRRAGALAAALLAAGCTVTGCARFGASLGQEQWVVQFRPQTTNAQRMAVRSACSHIPQATPMPLPSAGDHLLVDHLYDVRYQVGNASQGDLAKLQACLQRFRAVTGIEDNTPGGN
jgi:hypothetical protein